MLAFPERYSHVSKHLPVRRISEISMAMSTAKYKSIIETVYALYGGKKIELDYETPFQLLSAVILSAQTTDKQVNKITPPFFAKVREAKDVIDMPLETIE